LCMTVLIHILGNAVPPLHKRKEVKQFLCLIAIKMYGEGCYTSIHF